MISIDSYVVKRSIEHYGKDVQSTVCMEECAELIQAISKEKRGKSDKDHLAEEMADVIICIEMLKQIYNITEDEIYSWVITKQERIIRRIEKDTQSTKTNAERIRNMTDDELAEWLTNMCDFEKDEEHYKSIYNLETEELGVRAHIQHLQAYATKEETQLNKELIDPRYNWVHKTKYIETIFELTGTWATDPHYGEKIDGLLTAMGTLNY